MAHPAVDEESKERYYSATAPTRLTRTDDEAAFLRPRKSSLMSTALSVLGMTIVALATLVVMLASTHYSSSQQQATTPLSLDIVLQSYRPVRTSPKSTYRASTSSAAAPRSSLSSSSSRPNIVFILTDDQGVGDMDIAGADFEGLMPNIRRLNEAGWNLTSYYSASLCTPARSSLMTGRYAVTTGMGHGVIMATQPWGLPLSEVLLPELLSKEGYTTHHVGKWHLGHYSKAHLPTARGFDKSLGYYGGYQHPETFFYEWPGCSNSSGCIPDMHDGRAVYSQDGQFNVNTFADRAETILSEHAAALEEDPDTAPIFLYLAVPLIHMPVHPDPAVMEEREADLLVLTDAWRRRMGAMSIMLDSFVQRVESSLVDNGLMNNTILIYASDNGAQVEGSQMGAGSNFPLRGSKGSLYEGAVRVPAFIYSPLLGHSDGTPGGSIDGIVHVSDWLPTLLQGALGVDLTSYGLELDGINQWDYLLGVNETAPRSQVLLNLDTVTGISAIRLGNYKLLLNESTDVGWYSGTEPGLDLCFMSATNTVQLFDLSSDMEERSDISQQQTTLVAAMREEISRYWSIAPAPAYCGVTDTDATTKWFKKNEIEPWISLEEDEEGIAIDYTCPDETISSGWCTMVDADTALPPPPDDLGAMGSTMNMGGHAIKLGSKDLPGR